ncbi:MAG: GNAT family N-acetyltransferase [Firmicutes bacterium]|nr:GNAT family N-acetyltransferase [Bacillota bacterium]
MKHIEIVKGSPISESGAKLNLLALDEMAESLMGTEDPAIAEQTLAHLWKQKNNRFSHEYVYEAKLEDKTLGIVTCYPTTLLNRLAWPTAKLLFKLRQWPLMFYVLKHAGRVWNLLNLQEGRQDEFHIGTIATLPESRGMGVGTKLLWQAEHAAQQSGFKKLSLTVKQKNVGAKKLYERFGFKVTEKIDKNPFFLYRMVKNLA